MTPLHTADQLYAQSRWEQRAVNEGVARYRAASAVLDPLSLPPGQAFIRKVAPPLVRAITEAQDEAAKAVAGQGRTPVPWVWLIQLLPPEKLAVLTLHAMMRSGDCAEIGGKVVSLARSIAKVCRDQVEHDRWETDVLRSRKVGEWDAVKEFKKKQEGAYRTTWGRWKKKLEGLIAESWTAEQEVHLGAHLIHLAVASNPDTFVLETMAIGPRTHRLLRLSTEAQDLMRDLTTRAEVSSPPRLPMIVPPLPWQYD